MEKDFVTAIVMATMLEAKPFVLEMPLRQIRKSPFRLFHKDGMLLIISGVGKANAAMATTYISLKFKPACICNLGAAGASHSGFDLGEIFHIQKIVEPDRPDLKTRMPCVHKPDVLKGFKTAALATSDRAILDPKEREAISMDADLIDMEGASVVQAGRTFKKNCYLFKFVSDTPDHTLDQDIVDHIRRYRKQFYDFFADSVRPVLPASDVL